MHHFTEPPANAPSAPRPKEIKQASKSQPDIEATNSFYDTALSHYTTKPKPYCPREYWKILYFTHNMANYLSYDDLRRNSVRRGLPRKLPPHQHPSLLFLLSPSIHNLTFNASAFTRNCINFKSYTKPLLNQKRYLDPPAPNCICSLLPRTSKFIQQHEDSIFFGHIQTMDPTFIPLLKQEVCSRVNNIRRRATPRRPAISLAEVEKLLTTLATLMKYGFQHRPPAKLHEADLYAHIRASILQLYEEKRINSPDLYGQWVVALLRRVRMNFRKKHPNNAEFCGEDEQFGSAEQLLKHHGASATPPPPQSAISSQKMLDIASALFATKDSRCMVICSVVDKMKNNPCFVCPWAATVSLLKSFFPTAAEVTDYIVTRKDQFQKQLQLDQSELTALDALANSNRNTCTTTTHSMWVCRNCGFSNVILQSSCINVIRLAFSIK